MSIKNLLLRLLAKSFTKHQVKEKRFLVVSTTALGDTLWGTPAVRALRESFPQAHLAILTTPLGREVFRSNPHVNAIHCLEKPEVFSLLSQWKRLRQQRFSTALILHASQRFILPYCHFLGISEIHGTQECAKGLEDLLTHPQKFGESHEIERRLRLATAAGGKVSSTELELFLKRDEEEDAVRWLEAHGVEPWQPVVALHTGAKEKFRCWPAEHFIEVGRRLQSELGAKILLTGSPSEAGLLAYLQSHLPDAIQVSLPLRKMAACLKRCQLIITNDTGPLHVALAVGTPLIAIFGPTNPARCGPYGYEEPRIQVLATQTTCNPCLKKQCLMPFCLYQISPTEVMQHAYSLLAQGKTPCSK